jgi:hypothetical protein
MTLRPSEADQTFTTSISSITRNLERNFTEAACGSYFKDNTQKSNFGNVSVSRENDNLSSYDLNTSISMMDSHSQISPGLTDTWDNENYTPFYYISPNYLRFVFPPQN